MRKAEFEEKFGKHHMYCRLSPDGQSLRFHCSCTSNTFSNPEESTFKRHLNSKRHKDYVEKLNNHQKPRAPTLTDESAFGPSSVTYATKVKKEDHIMRRKTLFAFTQGGIPIHRVDVLREYLEDTSGNSLCRSREIRANYMDWLEKIEKELQDRDLPKGTKVSMIFDATPRLGDCFNIIVRYIRVHHGKVKIYQSLIRLSFLKNSMSAEDICSEIEKALTERNISYSDVVGICVDGCSTNLSAHKEINDKNNVNWLLFLCMAHMTNNAGDKTSFVTLELFWKLIMKVFPSSEKAKDIFREMFESRMKNYSDIRWYCKYEILSDLCPLWKFLPNLFTKLIEEKICVGNAGKLLEMVLCPRTSRLLAIELAAYVYGLEAFVKFTHKSEGDGELCFKVGCQVEDLFDMYPDRGLCRMPSVDRLVEESVKFIFENPEYQRPDTHRHQAQFLPEIHRAVPRPRTNQTSGLNAVQNQNESNQQFLTRQAREVQEQARQTEEYESRLEQSLTTEASRQAEYLPQTTDEWKTHIERGLKPSIDYFFSRLEEGGDRFQQLEIFCAASLWDPLYVTTVTREKANVLLEKLRVVSSIDDATIEDLKYSFQFYKKSCENVDEEDVISIAQWHYDYHAKKLPKLALESKSHGCCQFCEKDVDLRGNLTCDCILKQKKWWEVCQILVLLLPSSCPSERVFSLLENYFGTKQYRTYADVIRMTLMTKYNNRQYDEIDFERGLPDDS